MGAGVIEVLALEEDLRAAQLAAPALGVVKRRGPADVVAQVEGSGQLPGADRLQVPDGVQQA